MLQPEPFYIESLTRLLNRSEVTSQKSGKQNQVLAEAQKIDYLLENLIPENVSPAKKAVIERLITLWVADSRLDVA
jgi:hypothetical protein